jgi:hypothetical protein
LGAFDQYRESINESRAWFFREHAAVAESFEVLNAGFDELGRCLQVGRDENNKTHISLAPLLLIGQRQAFLALDALASRQAYQAWVLARPGIEAALVMGKWMEDLANFHIWNQRSTDPQAYRKAYTGKALVSSVLPRSSEIQASLKIINDLFLHSNPEYYLRHTGITELADGNLELKLRFFDDDEVHWASILGMLHLLIVVQESLARMFGSKFVNLDVRPDRYGLTAFEAAHAPAATQAARSDATAGVIIHDIGLWPR